MLGRCQKGTPMDYTKLRQKDLMRRRGTEAFDSNPPMFPRTKPFRLPPSKKKMRSQLEAMVADFKRRTKRM